MSGVASPSRDAKDSCPALNTLGLCEAMGWGGKGRSRTNPGPAWSGWQGSPRGQQQSQPYQEGPHASTGQSVSMGPAASSFLDQLARFNSLSPPYSVSSSTGPQPRKGMRKQSRIYLLVVAALCIFVARLRAARWQLRWRRQRRRHYRIVSAFTPKWPLQDRVFPAPILRGMMHEISLLHLSRPTRVQPVYTTEDGYPVY